MKTSDVLDEIARSGVIRSRDLPGSARTLSRLSVRGRVHRLFPGIYADPAVSGELPLRAHALLLWDPDAVITGDAAAALTYDRGATADVIEFHSRRKKWAPAGYRLHRSGVPVRDVMIHHGLRVTRVARTVTHLAARDDGSAIDNAFRLTRRLSVQDLWESLHRSGRRRGNRQRRLIVRDSRDRPWSAAERLVHAMFRRGGLTGWVTNHPLRLGESSAYLDIAFPHLRVVIEVDGYAHHGREQFESDRERQNELVRRGWRVIRVTWAMIQQPQRLLDLVRDVLADAAGTRRRRSQMTLR